MIVAVDFTIPFLCLCLEAQVNGACADDQVHQGHQGRPELMKPVEPAINEDHMTCVTGVARCLDHSQEMFLLLLPYCTL